MQTLDFLKLVTPELGQKAVVVPRGVNVKTGKPLWFHFPHTNHIDMVSQLHSLDDQHIYFALAGFKGNAISKYRGRKQENVENLRALWMDIDVEKDAAKKYPTKKAAGEALGTFLESTGLPQPLIVVSGGGLHVYWPLDGDVTRQQWKPVANALKNAALKHNLFVDHSRTSDEASILRPVGTFNRKIEGKPREVVALPWGGQPTAIDTIREILGTPTSPVDFIPAHGFKVPNSLGVDLASVETAPKLFGRIAEKCPQIQWARVNMSGEHGEKVSEPLWKNCVSIAARCKNGEKNAHILSRPYPTYTVEEAQAYFEREFAKDMPATCEQFNSARPEGCAGCRYAGKIKSPVILGFDRIELEPPNVAIEAETVVAEPTSTHGFRVSHSELKIAGINPPFPYKRTAEGIVRVVPIPAVGEDGKIIKGKFVDDDRPVSSMDIYPLFRTREVMDGPDSVKYSSYWRIYPANQKESKHDILIKHSEFASDDTLKKLLYDRVMYTGLTQEHKEVAEYMRSYMKLLGEQHTHPQPSHFGWQAAIDRSKTYTDGSGDTHTDYNQQPLEFVAGRSRYRRVKRNDVWVVPEENETVYPNSNMIQLADSMQPKGTLEGWSKGANWYKDSFASEYIAIFLFTVASPFMRYTKDAGLVILARGEKGVGKSLLMSLIASVWADPSKDAGFILGGKNTSNGLEPRAATLHNLPLLLDDKVEMTREALSDEIMMLANGAGKTRGNWVGGKNESAAVSTWCTNTLMSSNKSWIETLTSTKLDNEGETARLLEITMPEISADAWEIANPRGENLFKSYVGSNCGLVGPLLIKEFHRDPNYYLGKMAGYESFLIKEAVKRGREGDHYIRACEPREYRIHTGAGGAALLVLYILRKRKLVDWQPGPFIKVMMDVISDVCRMTTENRPAKGDILSQYINEFHGNFVIVTSEGVRLAGMPQATTEEQSFGKVPTTKIVGRIDHVEKATYLDRAAFKAWLGTRGAGESETLKGLEREGWRVRAGQTVRTTLGKGFPATNKFQTRVIELRSPVLFDRLKEEL